MPEGKMKKELILSGLIIILFLSLTSAAYPRIEPYVNDLAGVMSADQITSLNQLADSIEQKTTVEIAMITVKDTAGESRVLYAAHLGDENGVGKKGADNGVVVLYSLDNEKGGAISTGRGIGDILNDAKVGRIGRDNKHYFDDGDYYDGFKGILDAISQELNASLDCGNSTGNGTVCSAKKTQVGSPLLPISDTSLIIIALIVGGVFLIFWMLAQAFSSGDNSDDSGYSGGSIISSSSSSSSSGGRGGGGGFGGGGFGGGGAAF